MGQDLAQTVIGEVGIADGFTQQFRQQVLVLSGPLTDTHLAMIRLGENVRVPTHDELADTEALVEPVPADMPVNHWGQTEPLLQGHQQRNIVQPFDARFFGIGGCVHATYDTAEFAF